jgi:hypothetical protein
MGKPLYLYNGKEFLRLWEKVKKQQQPVAEEV